MQKVCSFWLITCILLSFPEQALKDLKKQRRDRVEEIKKKTNYYSTRDLLQKYDDAAPPSPSPLRQRFAPGQTPLATPQRPPVSIPTNGNPQGSTTAGLQAYLSRKIIVKTFSCMSKLISR